MMWWRAEGLDLLPLPHFLQGAGRGAFVPVTKRKHDPSTSCISGCSAEPFLLSAELHRISEIVVVHSGSPASHEECVQKRKKKRMKKKKLLKEVTTVSLERTEKDTQTSLPVENPALAYIPGIPP